MKPKEKAKELVDKYINLYPSYIVMFQGDIDEATKNIKQCALIAVDEVQQLIKDLSTCKNRFIYIVDEINYWIEVKKEIEKL